MPTSKRRTVRSSRSADPLARLHEIAGNLWWSWHGEAVELFRHADARAFAATNGNPVLTLREIDARRKRALARDASFMGRLTKVYTDLRKYLRDATWYGNRYGRRDKGVTAYFCMEYALHESLPLYAGGLGVLAGDHLKSASDLGIPLVAVGIYWRRGHSRQRIDRQGRQQDAFPALPPDDAPTREAVTRAGRPLRIELEMAGDTVIARAWRVDVGRVPLFLLDTGLPQNAPKHRRMVDVLYSGDRDARIRQEILLGIGGWRLLQALEIPVRACHLNEGHAAFLSVERIAERMRKQGETRRQASRYVRKTSVFTTHTPVPDGNEAFDPALVDRYMGAYFDQLELTREQFQDLGRVKPGNKAEEFGLTPLALRTSRYANGVAALHGRIARGMWKKVYPGKRLADVPIGHVTNGIHLPTWIHPQMSALLDEVIGPDWEDGQDRKATWARFERLDDARLWLLHASFKAELIAFCRSRLKGQLRRAGRQTVDVDRILDPDALTIGFARRFATYKRADLVFNNPARLARILNDRQRPVQLIFAGKAHPADVGGKALVSAVVRFSRMAKFRRRVVFLEDYDMAVARQMVAGCDVWLNNPQRPREASGTSGMKPALHGGLNLSILDGWWPEGFNRRNGWAIGRGADHDGTKAADQRDVRELYRVLTQQVVPIYYDRDADGLSRKWIARMKNALATIPPVFNTHRQVKQYLTKYYRPAMKASHPRRSVR